ncbi:unnamed protein product [Trichogramma brassicae]|uniref:inositol-polyphosphate 5-phosphatase n=1 Tax=Trichogramma brassicae TaxID=86971 RepID=A0A6H5ICH7_9HYME|nr:unnamed protein product [Trichogramma brassicae]
MSSNDVPFLLITANVGSIFEETIARLDPKFIALHCQEVGGKNYAESMRHVEEFLRLLMSSEELRLFDKVRVFLDEDFSSAEHFTALGNLYFAHETLADVQLWDFKGGVFVPATGTEIHSGNIETVTTKEKAKFPQDFFPECKWSRKGFLRTRWSINGTVFDLINIHLFHDASNFIAMETFPSVYSKTRRRALEHTLDRFHNDNYPNVPYFVFGDFNFRTDTAGVIKKLTTDTRESQTSNKGTLSKLQFHNEKDDVILSLGKKEFKHHHHQTVFSEDSGEWLREYDKEMSDFEDRLFEFPIKFVPSYPFEEDVKEGTSYMQTRVPAWCDRVLMSPTAKSLVKDLSVPNSTEYDIIGPETCMGDHKPVYLKAKLISDAGMINCCSSSNPEQNCFRVPESYKLPVPRPLNPFLNPSMVVYNESLEQPHNLRLSMTARYNFPAQDPNFLLAVPLKHDPYTPDSMDSSSPTALPQISSDQQEQLQQEQTQEQQQEQQSQASTESQHRDRAVPAALLKSKLELIVQEFEEESREHEAGSAERSDHRKKSRASYEDNVSWQRSHLLTRAWLEGEGQQAYHSFGDELHAPVSQREQQCQQSEELLDAAASQADRSPAAIPRIAIINASDFESNSGSVRHSQADDCDQDQACASALTTCSKSDQQLEASTYSNQRTRSLSGTDSRATASLAVEDEHNHEESISNSNDVIDKDEDAGKSKNDSPKSESLKSQAIGDSPKQKKSNKVAQSCKSNFIIRSSEQSCKTCCVLS